MGKGNPSHIEHLPETLIGLPEIRKIRSVFIRYSGRLWQPEDFEIELQAGERIINVESIPPNSAIGNGTRVWIECS